MSLQSRIFCCKAESKAFLMDHRICSGKLVEFNTVLMKVNIFCCFCVEDVSTDGKWCYIVFWVVGKLETRWNLLTKRLLEVCPSYFTTSGIYYYRPENQQPKPLDVFLLKFWCSYEQEGLLHGKLSFPRLSLHDYLFALN